MPTLVQIAWSQTCTPQSRVPDSMPEVIEVEPAAVRVREYILVSWLALQHFFNSGQHVYLAGACHRLKISVNTAYQPAPHQNFFMGKVNMLPAQRQLLRGSQAGIERDDERALPDIRTRFAETVGRFGQMCEKSLFFLKGQGINRRASLLLKVDPSVRILFDVSPLMGEIKHLAHADQDNVHPSWT